MQNGMMSKKKSSTAEANVAAETKDKAEAKAGTKSQAKADAKGALSAQKVYTWVFGEESATCNAACSDKGWSCVEGLWPESQEKLQKIVENSPEPQACLSYPDEREKKFNP